MAKTRLSEERIDLTGGVIHNESCKLSGHEEKMKAHEIRTHTAIGPVRNQKGRRLCSCSICRGYVNNHTVGPEH